MSVILILILVSLSLALLFLGCFIWAVRSGQFEDTLTPSLRLLLDEPPTGKPAGKGPAAGPVSGSSPAPRVVNTKN